MKVRAIMQNYPTREHIYQFADNNREVDFRDITGTVVFSEHRRHAADQVDEMWAYVVYDQRVVIDQRLVYPAWWPWWALKPESAE